MPVYSTLHHCEISCFAYRRQDFFLQSGPTSFVVWMLLKMTMGIRVSEEEEYDGVDLAECGMEAYPEFTNATS
jgi:ammonia channel protein AmtB